MANHTPPHRFPLGSQPWSMWREGLLLSTGFPVGELDRLSAPALASRTDTYLDEGLHRSVVASAFREARVALANELCQIARNATFREAWVWEQAESLDSLDKLAVTAVDLWTTDQWATAERLLTRWQRYCTTNDPIGFFGPIRWITVDPERECTEISDGDQLIADRRVFLEPWALAAFSARLADDPGVRRWLPPSPYPHHMRDGNMVVRPNRPPAKLTQQGAEMLSRCDGTRPAAMLVADLVAAQVEADEGAAYATLALLVEQGVVDWSGNLPIGPHTEQVLASRIAAIEDEAIRRDAEIGLERLRHDRDSVAAAAGDADALAGALTKLDATFTELACRTPRRRGWSYPGHAICYEDTLRATDVTLGRDLVEPITPALAICLQSARWLTSEVAKRFESAVVTMLGTTPVTLADIWDRCVELLVGRDRPQFYGGVLDQFEARWRRLLEYDDSNQRVGFRSTELVVEAAKIFAAEHPGWSTARVHSPDVLFRSLDPVEAVLGELHIGFATCCRNVFTWPLKDPLAPFEQATSDYGCERVIPLFPRAWSGYAGRVIHFDEAPADRFLGFARTGGVVMDRIIPAVSVSVERVGSGVVGRLRDGSVLPLVELCAGLLSMCSANALRDVMRSPHTPRIKIDGLVVWRESWQLSHDEIDLIDACRSDDDLDDYLRVRLLARHLRLPSRCFIRMSTRRKPLFLDLTNPLAVTALTRAVAEDRRRVSNLQVTVTEMLPDATEGWLTDTHGGKYQAEFRLHVTDPHSNISN